MLPCSTNGKGCVETGAGRLGQSCVMHAGMHQVHGASNWGDTACTSTSKDAYPDRRAGGDTTGQRKFQYCLQQ